MIAAVWSLLVEFGLMLRAAAIARLAEAALEKIEDLLRRLYERWEQDREDHEAPAPA